VSAVESRAVLVAASAARAGSAALEACRPKQWLKNAVLFAGLLFAAKLGDGTRWLEALAAFAAFSALSSASYLVNDVRDASADRLHPLKCRRPVARGDLAPGAAIVLAVLLYAAGLAAAAVLGTAVGVLAVLFAVAQAGYTFVLKRIVVVDLLTIAGLFVVRAATGAVAVDVHISPWLLACTALLASFLVLAKRRGELVLSGRGATPGRAVLRRYSFTAVDRLLVPAAGAVIAAYAAYTVASPRSDWMLLTLPLVIVGIGRYIHLVRRLDLGEEPENVLLGDRIVLGCVAAWSLVAALVVAFA
jgi:4-hydroxybenzoate polyprenyltransferase